MKTKLTLLAFMVVTLASAQKINPVQIGLNKVADSISVTVMPFKTTDTTCGLYFQLFNENKEKIDDGNLQLTEEEFTAWAQDNVYIEDLALQKLGLTRREDD